MAAAVFSRTRRHISKTMINTTPNPHLPDFTHNQFQLRKWYSRNSNFPTKTKHLHFPTATASSSSSCFGFVGWYMGMIKTRPIFTKSVTSAFIYSAADFSSQTIVGEDSERYSLTRTLRMAGYGLVILGPSLHFWFNLLSRAFPKHDLLSTLKKIAMGQLTFGPLMTTIFFSFNAAIQGESGSEIVARLKRDLLPTMINGIMYWPFCDFLTFKFIPVQLQPLVSNSFSYLWTVYMTYMANLAKVQPEDSFAHSTCHDLHGKLGESST